jgi:hypothetical protein
MDNLGTSAPIHYYGQGLKNFGRANRAGKHEGLDAGGFMLLAKAYERQYIAEAKKYSSKRRTYSPDYISRSDDGKKMYLDNFDQLGARWVKEHHEISKPYDGHVGWYTDDCGKTMTGVVLCFTRGGSGGMDGNDHYDLTEPKGRVIYMAGTKHSDWDGVTLDLDTTDDPEVAARWADRMAEREAEQCREEDEKYRQEEAEREALELAVEEEHFV